MEPGWAAENLQVIRTLMERSAVYRRALAPIMTVAGLVGVAASVYSCFGTIDTAPKFAAFWAGIGVVALVLAFLLARRQALREKEAFWSPPTRRVAQALLPSFLAGVVVSGASLLPEAGLDQTWLLPPLWMVFYGCGVHAAGFFTQRGIRLWGWAFVLGGLGLAMAAFCYPQLQTVEAAHYMMGTAFGVLHLVYGFYLYITERRK